MLRLILLFGLLSSAFNPLTFAVLRRLAEAGERSFQTAWFVGSLQTESVAVSLLRTATPTLASSRRGVVLPTVRKSGCSTLRARDSVAADKAAKRLFWRQRE